jgi:hypothetical protein
LSEHDMDFALRIGGDDPVHEVEKFDAPACLVVVADDFATRHIEGGEQRRRPLAFIVVRLAGDGAPIGQLQIALRACQPSDGSLSLADLIGLDIVLDIMETFYNGFDDSEVPPWDRVIGNGRARRPSSAAASFVALARRKG